MKLVTRGAGVICQQSPAFRRGSAAAQAMTFTADHVAGLIREVSCYKLLSWLHLAACCTHETIPCVACPAVCFDLVRAGRLHQLAFDSATCYTSSVTLCWIVTPALWARCTSDLCVTPKPLVAATCRCCPMPPMPRQQAASAPPCSATRHSGTRMSGQRTKSSLLCWLHRHEKLLLLQQLPLHKVLLQQLPLLP